MEELEGKPVKNEVKEETVGGGPVEEGDKQRAEEE